MEPCLTPIDDRDVPDAFFRSPLCIFGGSWPRQRSPGARYRCAFSAESPRIENAVRLRDVSITSRPAHIASNPISSIGRSGRSIELRSSSERPSPATRRRPNHSRWLLSLSAVPCSDDRRVYRWDEVRRFYARSGASSTLGLLVKRLVAGRERRKSRQERRASNRSPRRTRPCRAGSSATQIFVGNEFVDAADGEQLSRI